MESTEEEELEKHIRPPAQSKIKDLTPAQEDYSKMLQSLAKFRIGREALNPPELKSPPEKEAARTTYKDHVESMKVHLQMAGATVACKEFLVFAEHVSFLLSISIISSPRYPK